MIEEAVPIHPAVQAACEMLGFDPFYVANEGKLVVILPADEANRALEILRKNKYGQNAAIIGEIIASPPGRVTARTSIGSTRILDMLAGEMLPRIC
jgi:hydrogenase expression/formation protein HypE